jgi:serine protease Do
MVNTRIPVVVAACLGASALLGYAGGRLAPITASGAATAQQSQEARQTQQAPVSPATRPLPDFSSLVDQYGPAVVNISTTKKVSAQDRQSGLDPNDPFYEFFRRFNIPMPEGNAIRQGLGSGFIVSPDGYILTNAHVVADATQVTVKLTDKREFKAKVIGADKRSDVGLVKIDATDLPVVRIGDVSKSKVGEWVAAIGSPFGLDNSVTAGIISAKARSLPDESYVPFLQTDVAINPGNSGGPLFNLNGEVSIPRSTAAPAATWVFRSRSRSTSR